MFNSIDLGKSIKIAKKQPASAFESLIAQIRSIAHTLSGPLATAVDQIAISLERLRAAVNGGMFEAATLSNPLVGVNVQEVLLNTASTTVNPAVSPVLGAELLVVLTQDGTGGRTITWGPLVNAPTVINPAANSVTKVLLIGRINPATGKAEWYFYPAVGGANGQIILEGLAAGSYTLTTAYADIPGCTVTANATGTWLITANVTFLPDSADAIGSVEVLVNGTAINNGIPAPRIVSAQVTAGAGLPVTSSAAMLASVTGGQVIKLQAKKASGGGGSSLTANTSIVAEFKHA